jgi:hypothetical protein
LAALVAIAAFADLRVALRPEPSRIPDEVMHRAVDRLKSAAKPGDVIVHSPLFRVEELAALGTMHASPHLPPPEWIKSRRVLVLDRRDQRMHGFGSPSEVLEVPESSGLLEIDVYVPAGGVDVVLFQLRGAISPSTMDVIRGTNAVHCTVPRPDGGFACPGEPEWLYVQAKSQVVEGQDTPCIWAHPTNNGIIMLQIPAQPAPQPGRRLVLSVSAALSDDAVRMTGDGAPVRTDVVENGQTMGTLVVPNQMGWQRATVNVDPGQPIELRVTTLRDGRRHHCLNAEIIEIDASKSAPGAPK